MAGEIQAAFVFYSNAKPLVDTGKVRAIAITSAKRMSSWPDLPTMAEQGFAGFEYSGFWFTAPKKTRAPIIAC